MVRRAWLLLLVLQVAGCGYLADRGRDARDMMDFGFTTSRKFCFAIYQDYFNLVPHGYSRIDGWFHGVGARQIGTVRLRDKTWGLLAWGSEKKQLGDFDPAEPRQISPGRVEKLKAEGKPLPTEVPRYHTGFLRMPLKDNAPPKTTFFT